MPKPTRDIIRQRLAACPQTADELSEGLCAQGSDLYSLLGEMQRSGAIARQRSDRTEGQALYALPGYQESIETDESDRYYRRSYERFYENPSPD